MLREGWKNREKNKILVQAKENDWEIKTIQEAFDALDKEGHAGSETSIKMDLVQMGERPYEAMQHMPGVPTGLTDLDKLLDGFQPAELIIIAARPSMGKTDTLNHFALRAGFAGYKPIIFSLEMSKTSMIDRLIAITGGYSRLRMRNPYQHFTDKQKANWLPTLGKLNEANIHIDDLAGLKVSEIRGVTVKEVLGLAIETDMVHLAHHVFWAVATGQVQVDEDSKQLDAISEMIKQNTLAIGRVKLYVVETRTPSVFAFYYSENILAANALHGEMFKEAPTRVTNADHLLDALLFL